MPALPRIGRRPGPTPTAALGVGVNKASQLGNGANNLQAGVVTRGVMGADRAVGGVYRGISRVNSAVFYASFIAGALGMLSKTPLIGKAFGAMEKAAKSPRAYMDTTTVSEAGRTTSTLLRKRAEKLMGKALEGQSSEVVEKVLKMSDGSEQRVLEKIRMDGVSGLSDEGMKLAERARGLLEKADKVGAKENSILGGIADFANRTVFSPLGNMAERIAPTQRGRLAGWLQGRAGQRHGQAMEALDGALKGASGESFSAVREKLKTAQGLLGDGSSVLGTDDAKAFTEALSSAKEGLSKIDGADKKALKGIQGSLNKALGAQSAFNNSLGRAEGIRNPGEAFKSATTKLGNASLTDVALKGAFVAGAVYQGTSTARGVAQQVHDLKQMYCDLTGENKISTRKILFGRNVPPVIKEARGHILKTFGPRALINIANLGTTYAFMNGGGKKAMVASLGLMGVSQFQGMKEQNYQLLPMYGALNQMETIAPEQYAMFISAASKDAMRAGGPASALVQALALDYAQEGARPAVIMNEIANGQFDARVNKVVEANRTAMNNAGGHQLADSAGAVGGRMAQGKWTQQVMNEQGRSRQAVGLAS